MYIGKSVYDKYPVFVDLDDLEFFKQTLEVAKQSLVDATSDKLSMPVMFASRLSAQTPEESSVIERKKVHDKKRARRRCIVIDADYEADEKQESDRVRQALIDFAMAMGTPIFIYPTMSYPDKPRFRVVMFTKKLMNELRYEQAVRWLCRQVDMKLTDTSDYRITANRNLPVLTEKSLEAVYSTMDDDSLELLDNVMWRDEKLPKKRQVVKYEAADDIVFDDDIALRVSAKTISETKIVSSYNTIWRLIESIALAVIHNQLKLETAEEMMEVFAKADPANEKRYIIGNKELLQKYINALTESIEQRSAVRPLETWTEFSAAVEREDA